MQTNLKMKAFGYYRLSNEELQTNESTSITNQRMLVTDYCKRNNITIVKEFVDDGRSGGNFNRPAFQEMIKQLETYDVNMLLTKDLSRLGRDMVEASYYAEKYFPEHNIRYIATHDNFDSNEDNVLAPFQFAMNEVYLRDGSRKVRQVLKNKRERGEYCACPPYGYKKVPQKHNTLIPDEATSDVVKKIFEMAANGNSSRKIAIELTEHGIDPPLKYRAFYRDNFGEKGLTRVTDIWNYTTVKRILKNEVYLGHTSLGKSRKASVKSSKKIPVPRENWCVTKNTHPPLITQETFDLAQKNLGKGSNDYRQFEHVRKSIFSGLVVCELCGHSLCSAGSVYKGEREKYWYLYCTHKRNDIANPCIGTRIKYVDLVQIVRQELKYLISLSEEEKVKLVQDVISKSDDEVKTNTVAVKVESAKSRIKVIDKIISKLYHDNINGMLADERLLKMINELEQEAKLHNKIIQESISSKKATLEIENKFKNFFDLTTRYSNIEELDSDIVQTFIEKIIISPRVFLDKSKKIAGRNTPFSQNIRIQYKFIGDINLL